MNDDLLAAYYDWRIKSATRDGLDIKAAFFAGFSAGLDRAETIVKDVHKSFAKPSEAPQ